MIWNTMFSKEWSGSLKCMDTGVSLLTRVSRTCSAILNLNSDFCAISGGRKTAARHARGSYD